MRYSSITLEKEFQCRQRRTPASSRVRIRLRSARRLSSAGRRAFGRGDMAALAEVMADDIEWVDPGDPDDDPNAGTFKGKEAVLGWFGGLESTLDYTTFEPREFIAQNDKVVSLV